MIEHEAKQPNHTFHHSNPRSYTVHLDNAAAMERVREEMELEQGALATIAPIRLRRFRELALELRREVYAHGFEWADGVNEDLLPRLRPRGPRPSGQRAGVCGFRTKEYVKPSAGDEQSTSLTPYRLHEIPGNSIFEVAKEFATSISNCKNLNRQ